MITQEIFNNATQGHTTNIQPLIKIEKGDTIIGLSTISLNFDDLYYNPILLNIPSIKESIDIEKRNYKISSVNLNISNAPFEGNRFSDKFNEIINAEAYIYFKTQNATTLDDCLLVYYGRIRRMNQGENTLTLVLEDSSEQKIHKDIPKTLIPDTDFKSKYHNKPFPMAIGKIDRSPCVVSFESTENYDLDDDGDLDEYNYIQSVIIDSKSLSKIQSDKVYIGKHFISSVPLWVHMNDDYVGLHRRNTIDFDGGLQGNVNYAFLDDNTGFDFQAKWKENSENDDNLELAAENDTALNRGRVLVQREYAKVETKIYGDLPDGGIQLEFESGIVQGDEFIPDEEFNIERAYDNNPSSCVRIKGSYRMRLTNMGTGDYYFGLLKYHFSALPPGVQIDEEEEGWQKIISKVEIKGRQISNFHTWGNYVNDEYVDYIENTIYTPVVSIGENPQFRLYANRHFGFGSRASYLYNNPARIAQSGGLNVDSPVELYPTNENPNNANNFVEGKTFATNQESYDSLYGDNEIASVHEQVLSMEANNYHLGMSRIFHVGDFGDSSAAFTRTSDGFHNPNADVRIFSSQVWVSGTIDNILDKDFYANVWGRPSDRLGVENFIFDPQSSLEGQSGLSELVNGLVFDGRLNFEYSKDYNRQSIVYIDKLKQGSKEIKVERWSVELHDRDIYPDANLSGDALILKIEGEYTSDEELGFFNAGNIEVVLSYPDGEIDYIVSFGEYVDNLDQTGLDKVITATLPLMYPSEVIKHILTEECEYDPSGFNEQEFQEVVDLHRGWRYSFTQHEIINSKKLIEDIARSTKTFPRFKSDGSFGWATTKDTYSEEDVDLTIETLDVLSYKFDRTKLEDVKTKIKVDFWKDYANGNYVYSTDEISVSDFEGEGFINAYEYYNLPNNDSDSTLVLESDYIREYYTAEQLRNWLLSWHMNQHNIITLTLPLKYLKLEVGDIIDFDNEIANMLLYGEKYTAVMELNDDNELERVPVLRNGQEIYPYFMITETNKSLDKITIKAMQLHKHDMALFDPSFVPEEDGDDIVIPPLPTGDVNGDGVVNVLDVIAVIGYIISGQWTGDQTEEEFKYEADLNQSGTVDVLDIIILIDAIIGG